MRSTWTVATLLTAAGLVALAGCQSDGDADGAAANLSPVQAQIAHGGEVFANRCASCHGDAGQGTSRAPALVGAGALPLEPRPGAVRTTQFHTAMDIAAFATQNMPPNQHVRAQMTEQDYWAVLAFALSANGVQLAEPVGPDNAASIVLHP